MKKSEREKASFESLRRQLERRADQLGLELLAFSGVSHAGHLQFAFAALLKAREALDNTGDSIAMTILLPTPIFVSVRRK